MTRAFVPDRLRLIAGCVAALGLFAVVAGCSQEAAAPQKLPVAVKTQTVKLTDYAPRIELTGEIRAQIQSDLSFRVSGRVVERLVDVGAHVTPDQPLARLDPQEQEQNVRAAEANVQAAEAQYRQAASSFERQKTLLARGFTTRRDYDQGEETFRTAQGSLDAAKAQLETARDQLSFTILRAGSAGIITVRNIEAGQVVQAAQTSYILAQDGPRDAVFAVQESIFSREPVDTTVDVVLISNPTVKVAGKVREVAPSVDPSNGTVRVKVGLGETPPAMTLGATVVGAGRFKPRQLVVLPWSALASKDGKPAVWTVDPQTKAVTLRAVTIDEYKSGEIIVSGGLNPDEIVVTAGAQLLRPNEIVALAGGAAQ